MPNCSFPDIPLDMSVTEEDFECEDIDIKQEAPDSDIEPGSSGSQSEKPFKHTVWAPQDKSGRQHGQGDVILSDIHSSHNNQMKCEVKSECEEGSGESVGYFSTEIPATVKEEAEDVERQDGCTETASGTVIYSRTLWRQLQALSYTVEPHRNSFRYCYIQ